MNLIGKIFTTLILLLSICFFIIALMVDASHQNWKQLAMENKEKAERESAAKATLQEIYDEKQVALRAEKVIRTMQISAVESQKKELEDRLAQANSRLQTETQDKEEYFNRLRESESRLTKLDDDIQKLTQLKKDYVDLIAKTKTEVVGLTNNKFELSGTLERLEARHSKLAEQVAKLTKVMRSAELDENMLTNGIARPLDGEIMSINGDMVAISIGTDDGLRKGHVVEIHRNGKYVGKAEVLKADPNRSSGRLISPLQDRVQRGDYVTTKF